MCWCVCGVECASEQKVTQQSISKEEADSCTNKVDFCSDAGQRTSPENVYFLC